ncbi:MAG: hypothetical protein WC144_06335 [Sulfurimonas sp.]|jgi:hypothetical protein
MRVRAFLSIILLLDALVLVLQIDKLSISYDEAHLFFDGSGFSRYLANLSTAIFAQNDYALRVPTIILHLFSAILLYLNSKNYLKEQKHRVYLVLFFILTPGVISSAILLSSAGFVIFALLFLVYIYQNFKPKYFYGLLFIYAFLEPSFAILYMGTLIYALVKRDRFLSIYSFVLFFISIYIYGIDMHGVPKGYFLDSLGLYAAIFTPVLFVYMIYVLYRKFLTKDTDLVWYIATVAFVVSLVLSFRQRAPLELFAPYLIVAFLPMAQALEHSYRVRLKMFRKRYKTLFVVLAMFLALNSLVVFLNEYLYLVIKEPRKHFAHKMHIAKPLANELKKNGINCVDTEYKLSRRLEFYGIGECRDYKLSSSVKSDESYINVTISYKNREIYSAYVTKVNTYQDIN